MTKIIVVMSCGFVLCLGLSNATLAIDIFTEYLEHDKSAGRQDPIKKDEVAVAGIRTIKGEVLHVDSDYYLVRDFDADLRRLYVQEHPTDRQH